MNKPEPGDIEAISTSESKQRRARWVFRSLVGLSLGWFALAGGIGTFVLLRWINLAQVVANATAPLDIAGQTVLGVGAILLISHS
jgi:cell division septal protein FtsQ